MTEPPFAGMGRQTVDADWRAIRGWEAEMTVAGADVAVAPADGVGLCLSGGGFRAMLFHVGSILRLNDSGLLPRFTRISSVSGGSIAAAMLGLKWNELTWDAAGSASNLRAVVAEPLIDFGGRTIDIPSVIFGLRPGWISGRVAARYRKRLYGDATLQALPADGEGPRFVINATNLTNGTLWRFSRPYMRDYKTPEVPWPTLALGDAVAASSAFPPFLSPYLLRSRRSAQAVDPLVPPKISLTDGGVYDNLGIEPIWKRCETVFVSDGGGTFKEERKPRRGWLRGTLRVLKVLDVEVRRQRRHQIVGGLIARERKGAYWSVSSRASDFTDTGPLQWTDIETSRLAAVPTRLAKLDQLMRRQLVNWGYAATDAALRSYYPQARHPRACAFPFPEEGVG